MLQVLKSQCYWVYFLPFLFLVIISNLLIIPAVKEKIKVKIALAIPTGTPATLVNEMIDTPPLVALKTSKTLPM